MKLYCRAPWRPQGYPRKSFEVLCRLGRRRGGRCRASSENDTGTSKEVKEDGIDDEEHEGTSSMSCSALIIRAAMASSSTLLLRISLSGVPAFCGRLELGWEKRKGLFFTAGHAHPFPMLSRLQSTASTTRKSCLVEWSRRSLIRTKSHSPSGDGDAADP